MYPRLEGPVVQPQFQMVCERPPRSLRSRLPLTRGRLTPANVRDLFSPSVRGRAAEGGRGSLTHHLELGLGDTTGRPWLEFRQPMSPFRGERTFRRSAAENRRLLNP
jgi:hypothetical protein